MAVLLGFHQDIVWRGTIAAGGMGPGTPEMTATKRATHEVIQGGRWVVGTYAQEQFLLDGTNQRPATPVGGGTTVTGHGALITQCRPTAPSRTLLPAPRPRCPATCW